MNDKDKYQQEADRDDTINKVMGEVIKLIEPNRPIHQLYILRLLNFPSKTEQETQFDIEIDGVVSEINKLMEPLSERQKIYAMAKLNDAMRNHFQKRSGEDEVKQFVCMMMKSVLEDMKKKGMEPNSKGKEGEGHD